MFCTETHKPQSSTLCYTCTNHAVRREASRVQLGNSSLFFRFNKQIHYIQHSCILRSLHTTRFFRNISLKQNVSPTGGVRTTVTRQFSHFLVNIRNLMFLYTSNCNLIKQYRPKECTFLKLIYLILMFL